jgi:hypothetical protein
MLSTTAFSMNYDRAREMYLRDESSTAVLGRLESWMAMKAIIGL